jgi:hypothetical protein
MVPASTGGTFTGNVSVTGDLTVGGAFTSQGIDDNASSTAVTIDSSGNVGIGDSSPLNASGYTTLSLNDTTGSLVDLRVNDGDAFRIQAQSGSSQLINIYNQPMSFHTNDTERMRIDSSGNLKVGTTSTSNAAKLYAKTASSSQEAARLYGDNTSYAATAFVIDVDRVGTSSYEFARWRSNNGYDAEFIFYGNGEGRADGSFIGGGADYAEMFEWDDDNVSNEDRRGYSVVLTNGNKIRKATSSDATTDIIGVVSATAAYIGDAQGLKWEGKYERDDFGAYKKETYTLTEWNETDDEGNDVKHSYQTDQIPADVTVPDNATILTQDANGVTFKRRILSSNFDASMDYVARHERQEWDAIGMVGKLHVRVGQPTGDRWIKMRDITTDDDGNVTVEEWLVR